MKYNLEYCLLQFWKIFEGDKEFTPEQFEIVPLHYKL